MTSFREALRRLLGRAEGPDAPDPAFSYRVNWTREVGSWDSRRRRRVRRAVERAVQNAAFHPDETRRRYRVAELDDRPHAGVSLKALLDVLGAFEAGERSKHER